MTPRLALIIMLLGLVACLSGYFLPITAPKEFMAGAIYNTQILMKWFLMITGGLLGFLYFCILVLEFATKSKEGEEE